jgi:rhodanese-related sulfurtransferase
VTGAVNIPHTKLEKHMNELRKANGVVLYCIFGKRTRLAEQTLIEHDIPNVMHLEGGLNGWRQSGFEVRTAQHSPPQKCDVLHANGILIALVSLAGNK